MDRRTPSGCRLHSVLARARGDGGLGTALVEEGLTAVDAEGLPAVLDTSSTENERRYQRCGFAVAAEVDPPGGAPHVWVMVRPPAR